MPARKCLSSLLSMGSLLLLSLFLTLLFIPANQGEEGNGRETGDLEFTEIEYASYWGLGLEGGIADLTRDDDGFIYLLGNTESDNLTTTENAYDQTHNGGSDIYLVKLNPQATQILYLSYIGGSGYDGGSAIDLDSEGRICVVGTTTSEDFPTSTLAFQSELKGGMDAIAFKLEPTGSDLFSSTYLGGTSHDAVVGGGVTSGDDFLFSGATGSEDFPTTPGAYENDPNELFIAKLSGNGRHQQYGSYLGGYDQSTYPYAATVDQTDRILLTGYTIAETWPTTSGAIQERKSGEHGDSNWEVYIVAFNPQGNGGNDLEYSSYLGEPGNEEGYGIVADLEGNIIVAGGTCSHEFPTTTGAYDTERKGYYDGWVAKITPGNPEAQYITLLGGNGSEEIHDVAVNEKGEVFVIGFTEGRGFPTTPHAFDTSFNGAGRTGRDVFVSALNPAGDQLIHSGYLGGYGWEWGAKIDLLGDTDLLLSGWTTSRDFPTTEDALEGENIATRGDFLVKLKVQTDQRPQITGFEATPTPAMVGQTVTLEVTAQDDLGVLRYRWVSSLDGTIYDGNQSLVETALLSRGNHRFELQVQDTRDQWSLTANLLVSVSDAPLAQIVSIKPTMAHASSTVTLTGHALDDIHVVEYRWTSDMEGLLCNLTGPICQVSGLKVGEHKLTLQVKDQVGLWSQPVTVPLTIHTRPQATIQSISPSLAFTDQEVTFHGFGQGSSTISRYVWTSTLDGELANSTQAQTAVVTLSPGEHTLSLRVQDRNGLWSAPVTTGLEVLEQPTAVIVDHWPDPAFTDEPLNLQARGYDDGEIIIYRWSTPSKGLVYEGPNSEIKLEDLGPGTQILTLEVVDDSGLISAPVTLEIFLRERPHEPSTEPDDKLSGNSKGDGNENDPLWSVLGTIGVVSLAVGVYLNRQLWPKFGTPNEELEEPEAVPNAEDAGKGEAQPSPACPHCNQPLAEPGGSPIEPFCPACGGDIHEL